MTSFEYRLHPVGPVLGGTILHPFARAMEVLRFYRARLVALKTKDDPTNFFRLNQNIKPTV